MAQSLTALLEDALPRLRYTAAGRTLTVRAGGVTAESGTFALDDPGLDVGRARPHPVVRTLLIAWPGGAHRPFQVSGRWGR